VRGAWAAVAPAWGVHADELDARTAAITQRLLDLTHIAPGESVLELASGPGGVGLAAAERVGADGRVVISDVVPAMVAEARRRAADRGLAQVTVKELDLEDIAEPDGSYDVVLCREGLMFAVEPARAVSEMRRVLRSHGRVAVAVWAEKSANPWLGLLLDAITEVTGVVVPPPGGPGPFALGDSDRLATLFNEAGFTDLILDTVAAPVRAPSFDAWWERTRRVAGPAVMVLNSVDESTQERVRETLRAAVGQYSAADGALHLPGLALTIGGRRP
jgi:SAM-dependent methyltransferase